MHSSSFSWNTNVKEDGVLSWQVTVVQTLETRWQENPVLSVNQLSIGLNLIEPTKLFEHSVTYAEWWFFFSF